MEIKFTIRENLAIVSNNEMYMPRPCRGGRHAYMTKTNGLRAFEGNIDKILHREITDEQVAELLEVLKDDKVGLSLELQLGMSKTDFYRRDASDCIKTVEDALKFRLNVDDVRNTEVHSSKYILSDSTGVKDWDITMIIKPCPCETAVEGAWPLKIKGARGNSGR